MRHRSTWELFRGRHHRHPIYLEWGRFRLPRHLNLYYYEVWIYLICVPNGKFDLALLDHHCWLRWLVGAFLLSLPLGYWFCTIDRFLAVDSSATSWVYARNTNKVIGRAHVNYINQINALSYQRHGFVRGSQRHSDEWSKFLVLDEQ